MIKAPGQIVDSLTHITPDGRWFSTTADASEKTLLSQMDENGIEKSVVVGLAGYISNQFVLSACQRHSDRLLPVASFNPVQYAEAKTVAMEARKQLDGQGFVGLKLHPRLNQYDPLDPRALSLLDEIAAWETPLPIWLCTYFYYQGATLRRPAVDAIFELVSRHPTIPFILAHAGGPDILRLAHVVRHCPNAFLDLSFTLSRYLGSSVETDIRYLIGTFEKRLIFGSDFPEISQGQALNDLRGLAVNIKPGALERVLGINLLEILGQVAGESVKK
jgi:predicted TIM-barrel fold metal-dependent hydrolase